MRLSRRLRDPLQSNWWSRALDARRRGGAELVDLTVTNPTATGLRLPAEVVLPPLAAPAARTYVPDPLGTSTARTAVAQMYAERGLTVAPERVALAASTSDAYGYLFRVLTDPGDEVLVPRPSYPLLDDLVRLDGLRPVPYRLLAGDDWRIDLGAVADAITPATRMVLVVSPNNPTGTVARRDEIGGLLELCHRHELWLVADEVFGDTVAGGGDVPPSLLAVDGFDGFCLGGASKTLGLPQMKISWATARGPRSTSAAVWSRLELVADTYLAVSTPTQLALPSWLRHRRRFQAVLARRLDTNATELRRALRGCPAVEVRTGDGGWSALVRVPRLQTDEQWAVELLERAGVVVHPGYLYDFPDDGYLVLSLLPEPASFTTGVARLAEHFRRRF